MVGGSMWQLGSNEAGQGRFSAEAGLRRTALLTQGAWADELRFAQAKSAEVFATRVGDGQDIVEDATDRPADRRRLLHDRRRRHGPRPDRRRRALYGFNHTDTLDGNDGNTVYLGNGEGLLFRANRPEQQILDNSVVKISAKSTLAGSHA